MYFWAVVGALLLVVLALAWWHDHVRRGRVRSVVPPEQDPAVGAARAEMYTRGFYGMGPGDGP